MRLFLAAELPAELAREAAAIQRRLRRELSGWRWVRPDGIHLTLRFLDEVDEERDRRARESWREAAAAGRAFRLEAGRIGQFPGRGRPRVLWLGVEEREPGGELAALAGRLEQAARRLGWDAEERSFRPHLTLARADRRGRPCALESIESGEAGGWVRSLKLIRSRLGAGGASYTALDSFPLGAEQTEARRD